MDSDCSGSCQKHSGSCQKRSGSCQKYFGTGDHREEPEAETLHLDDRLRFLRMATGVAVVAVAVVVGKEGKVTVQLAATFVVAVAALDRQ